MLSISSDSDNNNLSPSQQITNTSEESRFRAIVQSCFIPARDKSVPSKKAYTVIHKLLEDFGRNEGMIHKVMDYIETTPPFNTTSTLLEAIRQEDLDACLYLLRVHSPPLVTEANRLRIVEAALSCRDIRIHLVVLEACGILSEKISFDLAGAPFVPGLSPDLGERFSSHLRLRQAESLEAVAGALAQGGDVFVHHPWTAFALGLAYLRNHEQNLSLLKWLLGFMTPEMRNILMGTAIRELSISSIRDLHQCGISGFEKNPLSPDGLLIHAAARSKDPVILYFFIDREDSINQVDGQGRTPLDILFRNTDALECYPALFLHLLDRGALFGKPMQEGTSSHEYFLRHLLSLKSEVIWPIARAFLVRGITFPGLAQKLFEKALDADLFSLAIKILGNHTGVKVRMGHWLEFCTAHVFHFIDAIACVQMDAGLAESIKSELIRRQQHVESAPHLAFLILHFGLSAEENTLQSSAPFVDYLTFLRTLQPKALHYFLGLSIKTFLNVVGDGYISNLKDDEGTSYEGMPVSTSCLIVSALLEMALEAYPYLYSNEEQQEIAQFCKNIHDCIEHAHWMDESQQVLDNEPSRHLAIQAMTTYIYGLIEKAAIDEPILIPTGWTMDSSKHATLTIVKKQRDGSILLRYVNTGQGGFNTYSDGLKTHLHSSKAFVMDLQEFIKSDKVRQLVEPHVQMCSPTYSPTVMQYSILTMPMPPQDVLRDRSAQVSGTCGTRCLLEAAHIAMSSDLYIRSSLLIKLDTIIGFSKMYRGVLPEKPDVEKTLLQIISGTMRKFNRFLTSDYLCTDEGLDRLDAMEALEKELCERVPSIVREKHSVGDCRALSAAPLTLPPYDALASVGSPEEIIEPENAILSGLKVPFEELDNIDSLHSHILQCQEECIEVLKEKATKNVAVVNVHALCAKLSRLLLGSSENSSAQNQALLEEITHQPQEFSTCCEALVSIYSAVAQKAFHLNSTRLRLTGQYLIVLIYKLAALVDDAEGVPKGEGLRLDDFPMNTYLIELMFSPKSPTLLSDPQHHQEVDFLLEHIRKCEKNKEFESPFDPLTHYSADTDEAFHLSIETGCSDWLFCDAHIEAYKALHGTLPEGMYEEFDHIVGERGDELFDNWAIHWVYVKKDSGILPPAAYLLRDVLWYNLLCTPGNAEETHRLSFGRLQLMKDKHAGVLLSDEHPIGYLLSSTSAEHYDLASLLFDNSFPDRLFYELLGYQDLSDLALKKMAIHAESLVPELQEEVHLSLDDSGNSYLLSSHPHMREIHSLVRSDMGGIFTLRLPLLFDYYGRHEELLSQVEHQILFSYHLRKVHSLKQTLEENPLFAYEACVFFKRHIEQIEIQIKNRHEVSANTQRLLFLYENRIFLLNALGPDKQLQGSSVRALLSAIRKGVHALCEDHELCADKQVQRRACLAYFSTFLNPVPLEQNEVEDLLCMWTRYVRQWGTASGFCSGVAQSYIQDVHDCMVERIRELQPMFTHAGVEKTLRVIYDLSPTAPCPFRVNTQWNTDDFPLICAVDTSDCVVTINLLKGEIQDRTSIPESVIAQLEYHPLFKIKGLSIPKNAVRHVDHYSAKGAEGIQYKFFVGSAKASSTSMGDELTDVRVCIRGKWYVYLRESPVQPKLAHLSGLLRCLSPDDPHYIWASDSLDTRIEMDGTVTKGGSPRQRLYQFETLSADHMLESYAEDILLVEELAPSGSKRAKMFFRKNVAEQEQALSFSYYETGDPLESGWVYDADLSLRIAQNQRLEGFRRLPFIILERRGELQPRRFALIPVYEKNGQEGTKIVHRVFPLHKDRPVCTASADYAIMARLKLFDAITPEDHAEVIRLLSKVNAFGPFDDDVLVSLSLLCTDTKRNVSNSANAIKFYVVWLIERNILEYPSVQVNGRNRFIGILSNANLCANDWCVFWRQEQFVNRGHSHEPIRSHGMHQLKETLLKRYFATESRIPYGFRLTTLLTPHEIALAGIDKYRGAITSHSQPALRTIDHQVSTLNIKSLWRFLHLKDCNKPLLHSYLPKEDFHYSFNRFFRLAQSLYAEDREYIRRLIARIAYDTSSYQGVSTQALRTILEAYLEIGDGAPLDTKPEAVQVVLQVETLLQWSEKDVKIPSREFTRSFTKAIESYSRLRRPRFPAIAQEVPPSRDLSLGVIPKDATRPIEPDLYFSAMLEVPAAMNRFFRVFCEEVPSEPQRITPLEIESTIPEIRQTAERLENELKSGSVKLRAVKTYRLKETMAFSDIIEGVKALEEEHRVIRGQLKEIEREFSSIAINLQDSKKEKLLLKIDVASGKRKRLTIADYELLFLHGNSGTYMEMTGLSEVGQIAQLHFMTGKYLTASIQAQMLKRAIRAIHRYCRTMKSPRAGDCSEARDAMIEALSARFHNPQESFLRPYLLIQKRLNIALTKEQVETLEKAFDKRGQIAGIDSLVIELPPGRGKTSTIIPLLAQCLADGYYLVLVLSLNAQYATNLSKMKDTSKEAYGQDEKAFVFEATPSYVNVTYLTNLYTRLREGVATRSYFNITKETWQALLAIERDVSLDTQDPAKQEVAAICQQILKFLRERGVVLMDECHKNYSPLQVYNLPVGEPSFPDRASTDLLTDMIVSVVLQVGASDRLHLHEQPKSKIKKLVLNALRDLLAMPKWQKNLALVDQNEKVDRQRLAALLSYLSSEQPLPAYLTRSESPASGTSPAFYALLLHKAVFRNFLLDRLKSTPYVDYQLENHQGNYYARPSIANMVTDGNSCFSSPLVMICNSLLGIALTNIGVDQAQQFLRTYKKNAIQELRKLHLKKPTATLDDTNTAIHLKQVLGIDLRQLNADKMEDVESVRKAFVQTNTYEAKRLMLEAASLGFAEVEISSQEMTITNQDIIQITKRQIAFSGTVELPFAAPRTTKIHLDKGANGETICLLRSKSTPIYACSNDYGSLFDQIVASLPANRQERVRLISDVGAHFTGMRNADVAALICGKVNPRTFKKVLFFDESNCLCAMEVSDPKCVTTLSDSTEEAMKAELNASLNELFIFLDQYHCEGTDIAMPADTIGIVTLNTQTTLTKAIQGVKRCRKIAQGQEIIFASHVDALTTISHTTGDARLAIDKAGILPVGIDSLFVYLLHQQELSASNEALLVAFYKIRTHLRSTLEVLSDRFRQLNFSSLLRKLYVQSSDIDLHDCYSTVTTQRSTRDLLLGYASYYLNALRAFGPQFIATGEFQLNLITQQIVKPALELVPANIHIPEGYPIENIIKYVEISQNPNQTQTQTQSQTQRRTHQAEQQMQQQQTVLCHGSAMRTPAHPLPCSFNQIIEGLFTPMSASRTFHRQAGVELTSELWKAREVLEREVGGPLGFLLDDSLLIESNLAVSFSGTTSMTGTVRKNFDYFVLVHDEQRFPRNGGWCLILLSQESAHVFSQELAKQPDSIRLKAWLLRPNGKPLQSFDRSKEEWDNMLGQNDVKRLLAYARLLHGDPLVFSDDNTLFDLDVVLPQGEQRRNIAAFYESHLLQKHSKEYDLSALKEVLHSRKRRVIMA